MNICEDKTEDVFIVLNDFNTLYEDVRIIELGEKRISELKYEVSEAYGQDGYTKVSEDAYRGFTRTSKLMISSKDSYDRLNNKIYVGLDVKVYYSDDDYKFRYGTISDIADNVIIGDNREITISIDLQPFKYGDATTTIVDKKTIIVNQCNVYNMPIIKVYGTGKGRIYINNQIMELNVDNFLTIDNKEMDIFDKYGLRANSRRLKGNFFRVEQGENIINFDGLISELEITTQWRWR